MTIKFMRLQKVMILMVSFIFWGVDYAAMPITCNETTLTEHQRTQIKEFVQQAIIDVKEKGIQQASKDFMSTQYIKEELYLFVINNKSYSLVNGGRPDFIGKNLTNVPDAQDSANKILHTAKRGGGWVSYAWSNPKSHVMKCKTSWVTPFLKDSKSDEVYTIGAGLMH